MNFGGNMSMATAPQSGGNGGGAGRLRRPAWRERMAACGTSAMLSGRLLALEVVVVALSVALLALAVARVRGAAFVALDAAAALLFATDIFVRWCAARGRYFRRWENVVDAAVCAVGVAAVVASAVAPELDPAAPAIIAARFAVQALRLLAVSRQYRLSREARVEGGAVLLVDDEIAV